MKPTISVIIPTYNRADMVVDCVRHVFATGWKTLEVIVVDDCSPDNTQDQLTKTFGSKIRYLRNEKNAFQAVSRNRGAACATGELFFFLDDDNLVHPEIFTELVHALDEHPTAGLVAPLAIHQRSGKENLIWTLGSDFNRWTSQPRDFAANLPLAHLPAQPTLYPTTYSPNAFLVPREIFFRLGGFNESFVQIFEESDFGWRLREAGYKAFIATRARTNHLGFLEPGCVNQLRQLGIEKPYRTYCFARNRLRFARRHFNYLQLLSICCLFAPLSCLVYGWLALKNKRPDIAWAYLRGTLRGLFAWD